MARKPAQEPAEIEPTDPAAAAPAEPAAEEPVADPAAETIVIEPAAASESEPVVATSDPAAVETEIPAESETLVETPHRVVYVEVPQPPRKRSNRAVGSIIAVIAAAAYAVLYAIVALIIFPSWAPGEPLSPEFGNFLGSSVFWVPVLFFVVFFVVLVLLVNRAGWWAYVLGSNVVALIVYFGGIGVFLLQSKVVLLTPAAAGRLFGAIASQPFVITSGLLALEITIWAGAVIAARGRRVKARNVEAHEAYERETAARRAEWDAERQTASPVANDI